MWLLVILVEVMGVCLIMKRAVSYMDQTANYRAYIALGVG